MEHKLEKVPGKWHEWLKREAAAWVGEGIVEPAQAEAILSRYEVEKPADSGGRLVTVLAVLGSLLVGFGVILFFASNWQYIPKAAKVGLILAAIVAAYGLGYYLAFEKGNYPRVGRSLIFLGSIFYGAGIWLIAQIFHISTHFPNGFLFWMLGILPLVRICGSLSVLVEAALLMLFWTLAEQVEFQNYNLLFVPVAAIVLWLGYHLRSRLAVGAGLLGLVAWATVGGIIAFSGSSNPPLPALLLSSSMGIGLFLLGGMHSWWEKAEGWSQMRLPYQVVGLSVYFFFLFLLCFKMITEDFHRWAGSAAYPAGFWWFFGVIGLGCLAVALFTLNRGWGERPRRYEGALALTALVVLGWMTFTAPLLKDVAVFAVMNLLLFGSTVGFIVLGYMKREATLVNFGLLFFVLDVIARYFDFFWDMLPKSVFFMAGGLLLLVGGFFLERNRRKMLREMRVMRDAA